MTFNSAEFFAFLATAIAVFWLLPRRFRLPFILLASYAFYAVTDWRFLGLIVLSTLVDYVVGYLLEETEEQRTRRRLLAISIVVNLSILALFKYFNFFADSFATVAEAVGLSAPRWTLQVILPIGLSFYTFQSMSYSIDVYRRDIAAERSPIVMATYVAFFPQLLAGPIERSSKLMPQLADLPRRLSGSKVLEAVELIVIGLFKKVAVADVLFRVVVDGFAPDAALFSQGPAKSWQLTVLAMLAFGMQQYCDFSGYSDMARGVAKLFGVELSRNFLQPKQSASYAEFWRRWHVTFMRWMRDYLFRPLESWGSGGFRTAMNVVIVFALTGLWHGARWPAVAWGLAIGLMVGLEAVFQESRRKARIRPNPAGAGHRVEAAAPRRFNVAPIFVLTPLLLTLPLQALPDWSTTADFYGRLFTLESGPTPWHHVIAVIYGMVAIALVDRHQEAFEADEDRRRIAVRKAARRRAGASSRRANIGLRQSGAQPGVLTATATDGSIATDLAAEPTTEAVEIPAPDVSLLSGWGWQLRTGLMLALVVLFGSNAIAAEFYYFQF